MNDATSLNRVSSPSRTRRLRSLAFALSLTSLVTGLSVLAAGCAGQATTNTAAPAAPTSSESAGSEEADAAKPKEKEPLNYGAFQLKPEPQVPCTKVDVVDVNLGHTPENFVKAAHCQVTGKEASKETIDKFAEALRTGKNVRRIDVVRTLCVEADRKCELKYSDPWVAQPDLGPAPEKNVKRDIGAVCMFFFSCPGKTNCEMNWANTHAPGMDGPVSSLGFKDKKEGVYTPDHPGFWRRELLDAQYAGLQFLALNTYGPDIEDGKLKPLTEALDSIENPIKIALFDDTWTWGEPWFSDFWKQRPKMNDVDATAKVLYEAKWKPFFSQIDKRHWYLFKGKPFIYFYNGGKLEPRSHSSEVFAKMKELFKADFGVEPFISADSAYFDDKRLKKVADSQFKWFTFQTPGNRSRSTLNGNIIDHAMVRWDSVGRERKDAKDPKDAIAKPRDLIVKDGRILEHVLEKSKDAELLMIATWNDLGEGTGINRNYDYYVGGEWLPPDYFMQLIRKSQSGK